ncbi:elongation factor P [Candidatus Saccharibacteria bacterium]|nr:elongation factor P [Candidatus Saccharibacteria bacterium]
MYGPTDLRKETLIELDGAPYRVVEYAQKQMGRGGSTVNTKIKNLITGQVLDRTFKNDERVKPAEIDHKTVQYLYRSGDKLNFMDMSSYETLEIEQQIDSNIPKYLNEGSEIEALIFNGQTIGFDWPKNVVLKVVSAPGGDKGNSASATTKEVELETGLKVQAPQFIRVGDTVKVDTRTGQYLERAK